MAKRLNTLESEFRRINLDNLTGEMIKTPRDTYISKHISAEQLYWLVNAQGQQIKYLMDDLNGRIRKARGRPWWKFWG